MAARQDEMTHRYAIYGRCLESTIEFPELRVAADVDAHWRFRTSPRLAALRGATELGSESIYGDVHARLVRHDAGHRIVVDDTGTFDLSADGRTLQWEEREGAWPDFVRAHLMGRVLATAMYLDGWLPLHGSAVLLRAGAVAFLAPKGFGKSSLALALTSAGAGLVTDDTLPVEPSVGTRAVRAWPGVQSLRVRDDALRVVGDRAAPNLTREGKHLLAPPDAATTVREPAPLAAIYLLDPRVPNAGARLPARTTLPAPVAAAAVVAHVKAGRMLGPSNAAAMLARAGAIARDVPVHRLHLARDLDGLPATAEAIAAWHGGPP